MIRLPAEWERQSAVFIAWPHASGDFGENLAAVEASYARIAREVSLRQQLLIACKDDVHRRHILARLQSVSAELTNVTLLELPYNDNWVRDTAPLTVITDQGPKLLDFKFNGWGGKYAYHCDDALAGNLCRSGLFGTTAYERVDFILEGGSIETDGEGTLMTTSHCLLNPNRNSELSRGDIEAILKEQLGLSRILWLDHGHLEGDDTDAHVDTLARFCSRDTIAYSACDDPEDPHYRELKALREQLQGLRTSTGKPYRLVELPLPDPVRNEDGERLPANYANFLIINDAVLAPVYDDPADGAALERLRSCFPEREVVAIPSRPLVQQYGSLHCMTMQFPRPVQIQRKSS